MENLCFVKDRNTTFKLFEVDCSLNLNLSKAFSEFQCLALHSECKSRNSLLFPIPILIIIIIAVLTVVKVSLSHNKFCCFLAAKIKLEAKLFLVDPGRWWVGVKEGKGWASLREAEKVFTCLGRSKAALNLALHLNKLLQCLIHQPPPSSN